MQRSEQRPRNGRGCGNPCHAKLDEAVCVRRPRQKERGGRKEGVGARGVVREGVGAGWWGSVEGGGKDGEREEEPRKANQYGRTSKE